MADSFFGIDTSLSNLNDDEGGGEPSEDEYDALNDETFGQDSEEFDWEVEHEHQAHEMEMRRRHGAIDDAANDQLEASLNQLVLDETDAPHVRTLGSHVWRHDPPMPTAPTPVQALKNVCTVEELERQLRQKQPQPIGNQNFYQPRFQPVILQRPPGLQAPVPLPFAPQQMRDMNQPLNKIIGQPNQMSQTNLMQNHMGPNVNQMGQNVNQMGQNLNQFMQSQFPNTQMGGNMMGMQGMQNNQLMQNQMSNHVPMGQTMNQLQNPIGSSNPMGPSMQMNQNLGQSLQIGQSHNQNLVQNLNQMSQSHQMNQNVNQMGNVHSVNQMGQGLNQLNQSANQLGQSMNQMGQGMNQIGPNVNPIGPNMNQMGQNMNQMGQNQMIPNGNQFGMNQFPHMMGQPPRMMAPPPGMNMPRQNFSQNMGPFNNFRPPLMQSMPSDQPPIGQNMMNMNPQLMQQQLNNQSPQQSNVKPNLSQSMNQPLNRSPQNSQPIPKMNQSTPKTEQKVQKSRVYNNSQQKTQPPPNMTSQNLVQLIQNTHPMLQFNSFHNANHHPMLNNRNNVFNNSQFVNNSFFNNQRHNGSFSNNRHMNGDSSSDSEDDYAGLMTQREKQWLVNIQMLQLNTGTPYIHDFYYTVFLERQASKEKAGIKEAHKANQQNHPFYSGAVKQESHGHGRERHNSNRHNSTSEDAPTPRTYVPTQFENSLGKLQCGSVTAPRKIIDVELVGADATVSNSRAPSRASTANPNEVPRELKRTKQLLLDIEALYVILLRLEELNDPLAISTALILKEREEKQKQLEAALQLEIDQEEDSNLFLKNIESVQRRPKQDSPKSESVDKRQVVNLAVSQKPPVKNLLDEDKEELMTKIFAGLLQSDRLAQMLTVRKGRTLICRFLRRVPPSHCRLRLLWARALRALPAAARRLERVAEDLALPYRSYMSSSAGWAPVLESCALLAEALDPARTPYALTTPFTLSCVCALVERASSLVNTPDATSNERQWFKFLKTVARALKNTTLSVARPVTPLPEHKLMQHLRQLESRTTIEILQRGKTAEFADLTKVEVQEQLLKHLC